MKQAAAFQGSGKCLVMFLDSMNVNDIYIFWMKVESSEISTPLLDISPIVRRYKVLV